MKKEKIKLYIKNAKGHACVIIRHKWEVLKGCFRLGLYMQGITHDLSKFSPTEFFTGVKNFQQGKRSPNARERELYDYSLAWMHHKGRNKHHFEYWTDVSSDKQKCLAGKKMPPKYFAEMVADRIAASKIYKGNDYTDSEPLDYLLRGKDQETMHPETYHELKKVFIILKNKGEKAAFSYVKWILKDNRYGKVNTKNNLNYNKLK